MKFFVSLGMIAFVIAKVAMENLYQKRINARKWSWWAKALFVAFCTVVYFWIADLFVLIVYQYAEYGFSTKNTHKIYQFLLDVRQRPSVVFDAYGLWASAFWNAANPKLTLYIPLLVPLLFLFIVFRAYMGSQSSFNLWYRLHNRFAKSEDVRYMSLSNGHTVFLGRFEGKTLSPDKASASFVWGEDGLGKTSTVAVPSILMANRASVVAIDTTGDILRYTSGHRCSQGNVFCFDWKKTDNPAQNEFWPRWNPLSSRDLPQKNPKRALYLRKLAAHFVSLSNNKTLDALSLNAVDTLFNFFAAKFQNACANDYLLGRLLDNGALSDEDKNVLLSYYSHMPEEVTKQAVIDLQNDSVTAQNYLPIGGWNGVPDAWKGKELCLAMIADVLQVLALKKSKNHNQDVIGEFFQDLRKEAIFFGYDPRLDSMLSELMMLDAELKAVLLVKLNDAFEIFRYQNIRERTSSSDVSLKNARGFKDKNSGEWRLSTFYLSADNPQSAFMSRLMLDMLLMRNMEKHKAFPATQMLVVIDDLDKLPKFEMLENALSFGFESNISLLLLTRGLKSVSELYGKAWVENLLACCSYKLLFAQDNVALSKQFRAMAVFGAKTLQIPAFKTRAFSKVKSGVADAFYYRKIADNLLNLRENKNITNGQHLLLVSGFYNLPVKVDAERFNLDARFNLLSQKRANISLPASWVSRRDAQDIDVPSRVWVLRQADAALDKQNQMNEVEVLPEEKIAHELVPENDNNLPEEPKNVSVFAQASGSDDEWWMNDDAFAVQSSEDVGLLKNS